MQKGDKNARVALITGATGMIGGEIAASLAEHGWEVRAVVRSNGSKEAASRLHSRLSDSDKALLIEKSVIRAIDGDTLAPAMGLSDDYLNSVHTIVHCAGDTSFKDGARCWTTNVGSAQRIIEFARKMTSPPVIFFISTASVCMSPTHCELSEDAAFGGYENEYTRSKRCAEQLLLESGLNVVIVRPSIVLSRGVKNRHMARSILWVILAMMKLGGAPIDPHARVDIVPVDYVADVIRLLVSKESLQHRCYHVPAGLQSSVSCSEIQAALSESYPCFRRVRLAGAESGRPTRESRIARHHQDLAMAISYYLPFINADVVYSNRRVTLELGDDMPQCAKATQYINDLIAQISFREALEETAYP